MKTFKVVYTKQNTPGSKVMFVEADDPVTAKFNAERDLTGSWGNFNCPYTFWEIEEVKFSN